MGRKNGIRMGDRDEAQTALGAVSDAFSPKAARADSNLCLGYLVAGALRVL